MLNPETRKLMVSGQVQGVGFRPFVYRLASSLGLGGWVINQSSGVRIVVQGHAPRLEKFVTRLRRDAPGSIDTIQQSSLAAPRMPDFHIGPSQSNSGIADALLSDRALCPQCRSEFDDPHDRRYQYPFINCADCGPRFSVCHALPYDRDNTAWRDFPLCGACREEFESSADRRFHAVGISCPDCGPTLFTAQANRAKKAIDEAVATLRDGGIVALKGTAGFQLIVDACSDEAVARLRQRKRRSKPLALLAPNTDWVRQHAELGAAELEALQSQAAPLVLLRSVDSLVQSVAPGTDMLAIMLPHSGLQLRLLQALQRPLVATSGNVSGVPLLIGNAEAQQQLADVADCFLLHDLELSQGLDDSIVRVMGDKAVALRLGRGLAPQVHTLPRGENTMGCGAQLKVNIALHSGDRLVAGPYIGDLSAPQARQRYREQKQLMGKFFNIESCREITDLHPDYASSIDADYRASSVPHHVAHAMAAWLEQRTPPPFLVLAWDGIGLGPDQTIWGGEWLRFDTDFSWQRVASIRPFQLPARHDIARFPGHIGAALLGEDTTGAAVNCTSMGRLIEGLASLAGLREQNEYEAQIAIEWEALAWRGEHPATMNFVIEANELDWRPLLPVLTDPGQDLASKALGFHLALATAAVELCKKFDSRTVLLSGGVFQNRMLVELMLAEAEAAGLSLLTHQHIPPNDGGIAIGQCVAEAKQVTAKELMGQCA